MHMPDFCGDLKRLSDPWNWSYRWLSHNADGGDVSLVPIVLFSFREFSLSSTSFEAPAVSGSLCLVSNLGRSWSELKYYTFFPVSIAKVQAAVCLGCHSHRSQVLDTSGGMLCPLLLVSHDHWVWLFSMYLSQFTFLFSCLCILEMVSL